MKLWKRLCACLLAAAMMPSLAACSGNDAAADDQTADAPQEGQAADTTLPEASGMETTGGADADAAPAGGGDTAETGGVLVVYYSATGHTETVANYIAQATGGDLFEITPAEPYTDDDLNWRDENSRVSREYADESLRDVELTTTEVENWDAYDTVLIGYPIWWGVAAWPVSSFVAANDFTGKTVIPFCTSSSSGLGESGQRLAELAGSGEWLEGQRFSGSAPQQEVDAWVERLGL